jgi:hypothetical protein
MMSYTLSYMVVEETRSFEGMLWFGKIVEQYWYRRQYLHIYAGHVHFLCTHMGVPTVVFYFPKYFVALYHACAAGLVMLQPYKFAIPKLLKPIRYMLRHDMGVYVYFHDCVENYWLKAIGTILINNIFLQKRHIEIPRRIAFTLKNTFLPPAC